MQIETIKLDALEEKKRELKISSQPILKIINKRRTKIDPKKIKRFNIKLGEQEIETYSTPRHKYDWTKSKGINSGWANVEELAASVRRDGMIHTPLVCSFRKFGYGEDIIAVQGWRRIRAAILNKSDGIDVDYTEDLSPEGAEILSFKENYNREPLSDSEISEFLWRIRKRHPEWTYEKIGEIFGLGGASPENKRKIVGTYLSHYDFLACHQQDVKEFDIRLRDLTRTVTMQIRATAREIVGDERKEEFETEILKAFSKYSVPIRLLCKILRSEHRCGNSISPLETINLLEQNGILFNKGKRKYYISLSIPPEIVEALKKYKSKGNFDTKKGTLGTIFLEIVEKFLKQEGYL
ncbi:MAG: hypothetical protein ACETWM_20360 [Candidatus Lokiarchaeia archaeon]